MHPATRWCWRPGRGQNDGNQGGRAGGPTVEGGKGDRIGALESMNRLIADPAVGGFQKRELAVVGIGEGGKLNGLSVRIAAGQMKFGGAVLDEQEIGADDHGKPML